MATKSISLIAAYIIIVSALGVMIAQGFTANSVILTNRHISVVNQALIKENAVLARQNHALLARICAATHC